ncbi:putative ankyrin repeat protein [Xylariales sp. PMI_506]|nr:putative ankyrin repeat protein [Xylariales sp. PMI_506]
MSAASSNSGDSFDPLAEPDTLPQDEPEQNASDAGRETPPVDAPENEHEDAESIETTTSALFSEGSRAVLPIAKSQKRRLGLDINRQFGWSGSDYDDYDIVTVHGIRDDYNTAWTDDEGVWWLRKGLFNTLSTRQVDYAYEVDEHSTLYESDGLYRHAQTLITKYAEIRGRLEETEADRPIIWVCHDLGGTIIKQALCLAIAHPEKYGKIAALTTAILFLGTPHRARDLDDLEDQLHRLILLPGPDIRTQALKKVKNLARQVMRINQSFPQTKLLDRAVIYNVFSQDVREARQQRPIDTTASEYDETPMNMDEAGAAGEVVTPFTRYVHGIGNSFESSGRIRCDLAGEDHLRLVRGDKADSWSRDISETFNTTGCPLKVNYNILPLQARLLSLAPPTRVLDTGYNPVQRRDPAVSWIYKHKAFEKFSKSNAGPRILHLHSNGSPTIDISEISRYFYVSYDANTAQGFRLMPEKSIIHFEFDQRDSRYSSISSMLLYFINLLSWRFATVNETKLNGELRFLMETQAWTLDDQYHIFEVLRSGDPATKDLTFFISCFDQCPEEERKWFMDRVLELQSHSELDYMMIISTSTRDTIGAIPDEVRIDLSKCPALLLPTASNPLAEEIRLELHDLISKRPIYESFLSQLESLIEECSDTYDLGFIILNWLGESNRGVPRSSVEDTLRSLSPVTPETLVNVLVGSLRGEQYEMAQTVFNWVKHAAEPWTPSSLVEALAVHRFHGKEPCFDDLDPDGLMDDIKRIFGGMIILDNCVVKFSHHSFYNLPEIGIEGTADEKAARVNSEIAETCLRYFLLTSTQDGMSELLSPEHFEGGPWDTLLDATAIARQGTSMLEYAVRYWPQHYKASGIFKPSDLVRGLFSNLPARAAWEVPFYTMSNPFTRTQRSYISALPLFAMLGLDDLVRSEIGPKSKRNKALFEKDYWLAITEATATGNTVIIRELLELVDTADELELQNALSRAAAYGKGDAADILIDKIPDLALFQWPADVMHRAAAAGVNSIIGAMVRSGHDIDDLGEAGASPISIAAWRNQVSTVDFLLALEKRPNLTIQDDKGASPISFASRRSSPRIVETILQADPAVANLETEFGMRAIQVAVEWANHRALEIICTATPDFERGEQGTESDYWKRPPLVVAAEEGYVNCVRVLLENGADPNIRCDSGTALYNAVRNKHVDIVRLLLENEPKADATIIPEGDLTVMLRAVCTRNPQLVSLLIEHGVKIDYVDANSELMCKTPLSRAAYLGEKAMVELLLDKGADINLAAESDEVSDAPLFSAVYAGNEEVARLLLTKNVDIAWAAGDRWNVLHASYKLPDLIPEILAKGADINGQGMGGSILHIAARLDRFSVIEVLLKQDPRPELNAIYDDDAPIEDEAGCTALLIACKNKAIKSLELLLKAGADLRIKNTQTGEDAVGMLLSSDSDPKETEECLKMLLSEKGKIDTAHIDEKGDTLLHKIGTMTSVALVQLLVEAGVPVDLENKDGFTPLAIAARHNNLPVVKYLVDKGCRVNVYGASFGSIAHLACVSGNLEMIRILIDAGADHETVHPDYGESLLYTALSITNRKDLAAVVRYLVDEVKVPINKLGGRYGYPIIYAASLDLIRNPSKGLLRFLVRRKANLELADDQGRRAVHLAATSIWDNGLRILVEAGADPQARDKFGRTPLHFAASSSWYDTAQYLMNQLGNDSDEKSNNSKDKDDDDGDKDKESFDVNVIDHDGWTPLMWAARSGAQFSIQRLLDAEADVWVRGRSYDAESNWSALKLANFNDLHDWTKEKLEPPEDKRTRTKPDGTVEVWDQSFHESKVGHPKDAPCWSCLVVSANIHSNIAKLL